MLLGTYEFIRQVGYHLGETDYLYDRLKQLALENKWKPGYNWYYISANSDDNFDYIIYEIHGEYL
jgi:hypothetical protein